MRWDKLTNINNLPECIFLGAPRCKLIYEECQQAGIGKPYYKSKEPGYIGGSAEAVANRARWFADPKNNQGGKDERIIIKRFNLMRQELLSFYGEDRNQWAQIHKSHYDCNSELGKRVSDGIRRG